MGVSSPEYHIVGKRVAAGRLQLGTIVDTRDDLRPINNGERISIDENDISNFDISNSEITIDVALTGTAGVAAKVLALDVAGGGASIGMERGEKNTYRIPDIRARQFDPEEQDYLDAMNSTKVQKFLASTKYRPVYMITGFKESTKMSVDLTKVKKTEGGIELGIDAGTAISIGPKLGLFSVTTVDQKGEELTPRIFAVRLRKLRYHRKRGFLGIGGSQVLINEASNDGAELVGVHKPAQNQGQMARYNFEVTQEDDSNDELENYRRIAEEGVTWVFPMS